LAVSAKNEIFITDSESNKLYKIQRPGKTLEVFLDAVDISNSNGITISNKFGYLFLASSNGICIVEIKSKNVINEPNNDYAGIDGLKLYNGNLYGINNDWRDNSKNGLYKYILNKTQNEILKSEKILEFTKGFIIPTTFDIFDSYIYFVINAQLDNFDENKNRTIDLNKLESYKLFKIQTE